MLEIFIKAVLAGALDRVANECWTPTSEDAANALGAANLSPSLKVAFVEFRIDLTTTFDQVERCNGCVSGALFMD